MNDEPDETYASEVDAPPDFIWNLMEAIDRGAWLMEIRFGIEAIGRPPNIRLRPTNLPESEDESESEAPRGSLRAAYRLSREKVRALVVNGIRTARRAGQPVLVSLGLLSRLDRACFLELAVESFADLLRISGSELPQDDPLVELVMDLREFDPELVPQIVTHVTRVDRVAGERLRWLLLDALAERAYADQLGLLTAQSLCGRLEPC